MGLGLGRGEGLGRVQVPNWKGIPQGHDMTCQHSKTLVVPRDGEAGGQGVRPYHEGLFAKVGNDRALTLGVDGESVREQGRIKRQHSMMT